MPAAAAHATIRLHASGLRTARAHVAHLFVRSGGSYRTCFALCVCEANDTDYLGPAFGAPLLIRSALSALDASCDCACCDQASRIGADAGGPCARCAPFLTIGRLLAHLFCTFCVRSKRHRLFGAPLLIRSALSVLDASCDCACYDLSLIHI